MPRPPRTVNHSAPSSRLSNPQTVTPVLSILCASPLRTTHLFSGVCANLRGRGPMFASRPKSTNSCFQSVSLPNPLLSIPYKGDPPHDQHAQTDASRNSPSNAPSNDPGNHPVLRHTAQATQIPPLDPPIRPAPSRRPAPQGLPLPLRRQQLYLQPRRRGHRRPRGVAHSRRPRLSIPARHPDASPPSHRSRTRRWPARPLSVRHLDTAARLPQAREGGCHPGRRRNRGDRRELQRWRNPPVIAGHPAPAHLPPHSAATAPSALWTRGLFPLYSGHSRSPAIMNLNKEIWFLEKSPAAKLAGNLGGEWTPRALSAKELGPARARKGPARGQASVVCVVDLGK